MLTALVIDDEPYAREELIELLEESQQIRVIGECSNAIDGLKQIHSQKPDVVFLDIQMPQVTGIELLSMLDPDTMPHVVFVTAYDEFALQAFEDNAFDYLLKPVEPNRLQKTLCRLNKHTQKQQDYSALTTPTLDLLPCMGHNRIILVKPDDIQVAFSDLSGVHLVTQDSQVTTQLTLKTLEEKTPLMRCHRQYLINPLAIKEIRLLDNGIAEISTQHDYQVPVSRRYLRALKERLGLAS